MRVTCQPSVDGELLFTFGGFEFETVSDRWLHETKETIRPDNRSRKDASHGAFFFGESVLRCFIKNDFRLSQM